MNTKKVKQRLLRFFGKSTSNGRLSFVISYLHNRHRLPNLRNPKDLSEIWIKRVLDGKINELYLLADKHAVRDYVSRKGFPHILTPELGVYKKSDEINFDILPERFALKANFGAGRNIICLDKSRLDFDVCRRQVDEWLKPKSYSISEKHYNLIDRKFICEAFIDDGTGGFPIDYKFMCIHGKVKCILACSGRENGHADYLPYSIDWKPLYDYYRKFSKDLKLLAVPNNLNEMIHVAEVLSEDIDLIRVDLYSNGSKIWFGEMTLTPSGCIFHRWSRKAINEMGKIYLSTKDNS